MTSDIRKRYFDWMCERVDDHAPRRSYRYLLRTLYDIDFRYSIEMDSNRESDGIDLRYRFGDELGYDHRLIACHLDNRPCSILEMIIALANRIEESIMGDSEIGNRTGKWFWDMLDNLGLLKYDDTRFDENSVYEIVDRFLDRDYNSDGEGGLFTVKHHIRDLRDVEIWAQMMWHLNDVLDERGKY